MTECKVVYLVVYGCINAYKQTSQLKHGEHHLHKTKVFLLFKLGTLTHKRLADLLTFPVQNFNLR